MTKTVLDSKIFVLEEDKIKLPYGINLTGPLNIILSLFDINPINKEGDFSYFVKASDSPFSQILSSTFYHGKDIDEAREIFEEVSGKLEQGEYVVNFSPLEITLGSPEE